MQTRRSFTLIHLVAIAVTCLQILPQRALAHFSYSDPRVVHVTEGAAGDMIVLVRMPAPLALLPANWQGASETRLPPFGRGQEDDVLLDQGSLRTQKIQLHQRLSDGLTVWINDAPVHLTVIDARAWLDADRPTFGTAKSALKSFAKPTSHADLPYFDTTLDIAFRVPGARLTDRVRIASDLGRNFEVMDRFGTVIKLHRKGGTETRAMMGVLDATFAPVQSQWQSLGHLAWLGAEHIYSGLDHLAMILLIAIAATHWRQALFWASAFTAGHILTLTAGLYGHAPQADWFITTVEILIVSSIVAAGSAIALKLPHVISWPTLFAIGLIHGYGFASAANAALFAGSVDTASLAAFALGFELCQCAVYLAILPLVVILDQLGLDKGSKWRRPVALGLAALASISVLQQLMKATGFSVA